MTMCRFQAPLRQFLSAGAIMVLLTCSAAFPALGQNIGAAKSDLIPGLLPPGLLPTVVNISVQKVTATPVGATVPGAVASPTIKRYVGSGFIIDPSGLIVTNYHVVEDVFEITVTFSDGSSVPGKMLSASRIADLAILKVEADHPLQEVHWGNSDELQVGDQVFAAGNPFGIGVSFSAGIVSALNRDIHNSPYDDYIQTDAAINHGNSGGPLFDMQGRVVGVDSNIISPTTGSVGLGFAMPSNTAHFVVDQLRTYGWDRPSWIGVKVQTVTQDMADAMGTAPPKGSIVAWVVPGGPAEKAGLAIGDVISRYDGGRLSDERALLRDIARTPVGDTITLTARRDGSERSVLVATEVWPRNQWEARDAPVAVQEPRKIVIPRDLGLALSVLPAGDRSNSASQTGPNGVLVTSVAANSDPAQKGMAGGDVILRVQDKLVATPAEVQSGIDAARADKRDYLMMLVLPKKSDQPGPRWIVLKLGAADT